MKPEELMAIITDMIYASLFDQTCDGILSFYRLAPNSCTVFVGEPDDDGLAERDHMHWRALQAISEVERAVTQYLKRRDLIVVDYDLPALIQVITPIALKHRRNAKNAGVDLLTGRRLLGPIDAINGVLQ
jgi:hypothetical protein